MSDSAVNMPVTKQVSGHRSAPEHSVQCQTQVFSFSSAVSVRTTYVTDILNSLNQDYFKCNNFSITMEQESAHLYLFNNNKFSTLRL